MKPTLLALSLALTAACGGGTTTTGPSPLAPDAGLLAGTWHGTVTYSKPIVMTVTTTWTFTTVPQTGGHGFDTKAEWRGITTRAMTSTLVGAQFSSAGAYPSPNGCDGFLGGLGTADAHTIDATFDGNSDCDAAWAGHLTLTR